MHVRANRACCTCMRLWLGYRSAAFVLKFGAHSGLHVKFAAHSGLHGRCMYFRARLVLHAAIMIHYIHTRSEKWEADLAGGNARSVKNYNRF